MTIASNLSFLQNSAGAITTGTVNAIGSPITFSVNNTEYNRIDTNGYSLMGYTTSQGAYKLQVNGTIYASGSIIGNITGNVTGTVTTSSNVAGGTAGQLVYQSAPGITGFAGPGTSGQLLVSAGTGAPTYTNTASISVGYAANVLAGATGSIHYQTAANATGMLAIGTAGQFLTVNAGATAPQWTTTSTAQIGYAANILAGTTGQLVYQSAANTTGFVGPGTANQILVSAGASAPVYTNTGSIQVGYSANILAGTTGQLVYQSAANTTGFVGPGTAGQFLQSAGAGAPTYVSTGTMYVQRAVQADSAVGGAGSVANALTISTGLSGSPSSTYNGSAAITLTLNTASLMASSMNIYGGTTGQLVYQSAANTTGFVGPGTAGQLLVSAGASAPTYTNTASISVGYAANDLGGAAGSVRYQSGANASTFLSIGTAGQFLTVNAGATAPQWTTTSTAQIGYAANILAGTTGQLVYQSAANTTGFVGPGTAGQLLVSAGASAPVYTNTASIFVNSARYADNLTGGAGGSILYQSAANATTSLAIGTNGYVLTSNGSAPVWTIASSVTSGNATNAANIATVIQTANANYFPTFVSANNATSANMAVFTTSSFYINPSTGATVHSGSVLATGGLYSGATSGATRALLSSNGDLNSFFAAESTARIQLGRDVGVSGGAGLALGGSSYALIGASDTAGAILYFKLSASAGTASTSPNMTLNSTGLGIGTTGVGAPLSFVDATGLKIQLNANAANYYAIEKQAAINGGDGMFKYNAGQTSAGEHGFYSGNALKLLIDASGNAIHAQGSNIVIRGSSGASAEGAQIVLGYGNNTSSTITGQANYTWNIDVASGLANNNLRIFRQNSAGVTVIGAEFTEATGGVQLISVGVGTTSTGVTGELRATNEITAYFGSDARLKENVKLIDDPITLINQIRGVYFDWTDEHINRRGGEDGYFVRKHDIGVIAQEIEAVLPEIVATRDDGFKAVRYEKIVPLLIESIKAQQKQITQLQALVDQLVNK